MTECQTSEVMRPVGSGHKTANGRKCQVVGPGSGLVALMVSGAAMHGRLGTSRRTTGLRTGQGCRSPFGCVCLRCR